MNTTDIDSFWERDIYSQGLHLNKYPYDAVVTFIFRHRPRHIERAETRLLEIGCGAGNNLWLAAREGFQVAGIDGSESAVRFASERLKAENLQVDLRVGSFTELPWEDDTFDLAIDRCSLVCVGTEAQRRAVREVWRVLKPGGRFFCNLYSDVSSSAISGQREEDGRTGSMTEGTLAEAGSITFSGRQDIESLFGEGWARIKLEHVLIDDCTRASISRHAEWRLIAQKTDI